MSEIILSNRTLESQAFQSLYGVDMGNVSSCDGSQQNRIMANRPYLLSSQPSVFDKTALAQLANPHIARDLTALSVSHGGDTISAAAQAIAPLFYENKGSIGTVASVYAGRMEGFIGSVKNTRPHYYVTVMRCKIMHAPKWRHVNRLNWPLTKCKRSSATKLKLLPKKQK